MKVIPKQKEYIAIRLDYSEEMFLNIGKYLEENKDYKLVKDPMSVKKRLYILMGTDFIQVDEGSYLLIDENNITGSIYSSSDNFKKDYIEIKEATYEN